jgi:hypothetical protein
MKWEQAKEMEAEKFKRVVGVNRETFGLMLEVIIATEPPSTHPVEGDKRGAKHKLPTEDELLIMLMYYREYRSQLHIAVDFGISESQCCRIVNDFETRLIRSGRFSLPSRRGLAGNPDGAVEAVAVDVAEHPVERPKKNSGNITPGKRSGTRLRARSSLT